MKYGRTSQVGMGIVLLNLILFTAASATTSDPVGVTELTIAAGNVPVAPAYVHPKSYEGDIDSVSLSGSELTLGLAGTPLTSGSFNEATYPMYYLEVLTPGTYQGMYFDIISNTGNQIVISTWEGTPQPLEAGNLFVIRKHMTLGDFFEGAEGDLVPYVDNVIMFFPGLAAQSIYWTGSSWTKNGVSDDSSSPIYPGQGLLTYFSSEVTFLVFGSVKTTPTQVPAYAGEINLLGTLSPVDETFGDLGTASWMVPYVDRFVTFPSNGVLSTSLSFFSTGAYMTTSGSNNDSSILWDHEAFLFLPGTDVNWIQPAAHSN